MHCPFEKFTPSQLQRDDLFFMKMAYNQALEAWKLDEVPIGAIIVKDNQIIASSHNQVESTKDPTAHAEILAITQAANTFGDWRLNQATLYVTKEPCPMCSGASIMARLSKVLYATPDPKMGCLASATQLQNVPGLNHQLQAEQGPLAEECTQLLQAFFKQKRQG